jgi:hypothetical protein
MRQVEGRLIVFRAFRGLTVERILKRSGTNPNYQERHRKIQATCPKPRRASILKAWMEVFV